jgi:RNA-directed DNA polymerase
MTGVSGGRRPGRVLERVQRDALMARLARRLKDKQVLGLIRSFLEAGVMSDRAWMASEQGTPQRSPLLGNAMFDDLD